MTKTADGQIVPYVPYVEDQMVGENNIDFLILIYGIFRIKKKIK